MKSNRETLEAFFENEKINLRRGDLFDTPPEPMPEGFDMDATRRGRDVGKIAEEAVQHLSGLVGAEVKFTLEISIKITDGAPGHVVRTVTENCNTLYLTSYGFEKE